MVDFVTFPPPPPAPTGVVDHDTSMSWPVSESDTFQVQVRIRSANFKQFDTFMFTLRQNL
jgi:hypothetical protein